MENHTIDTAPWFRALYLGAGGALICGAVAAFAVSGDSDGRWTVTLLLGGAGVGSLLFARSRSRWLTLEPEGLRGRPFGLVLWSDVENVFVKPNGFNRVLGLTLREPAKYQERLPRWRRSLWRTSQAAGFGDVSFDITGLRVTSDELVANIRRRIESEHDGQHFQPGGPRPAR